MLVLVVGDGELSVAVAEAVTQVGGQARRLRHPTDGELAEAVRESPSRVVVVSHDDIEALRYALVAAHARPGVPLIVTIFDRTVAHQIRRTVANSHVVSLADAVVPSLAAACLSEHLLLVAGEEALMRSDDGDGRAEAGGGAGSTEERADGDGADDGSAAFRIVPVERPSRLERAWRTLRSQLHPFDGSARVLVAGVAGLIALLLLDVVLLVAVFGERLLDALYEAVKVQATLDPNPHAEHGPDWYRAVATVSTMLTTAMFALFTAGLVNWVFGRRLVTILGTRTLPRRHHVVVVGLGQIGLRLCLEMRRLGVPPVAVERDGDAPFVALARRLRIPVVIGDGGDRTLLEGLRVDRARAVATVTSDDLVNIAVSVAALAVNPGVRVVLRAGDDDAVTETRALFPIGVARDVNRIGGVLLAAIALGRPVECAFVDGDALHLRGADGWIERVAEVR